LLKALFEAVPVEVEAISKWSRIECGVKFQIF